MGRGGGVSRTQQPEESVRAAYADLLDKARNDKGRPVEQDESDPTYRFVTSYGSVIGGICSIVFGLLMVLVSLLLLGSPKLAAAFVLLIIAGAGWLVQGLNYVTYYHWKDRGGRGSGK